jgi:hypothetical protein
MFKALLNLQSKKVCEEGGPEYLHRLQTKEEIAI